jgi:hypothetical protein
MAGAVCLAAAGPGSVPAIGARQGMKEDVRSA